jgi:alanyl-tRNA synthetase
VAIVAATGGTPDARELVRTLGPLVGGGGGGSPEVATAGGKDPSGIEAALAEAQRLLTA